MWGKRLERMSKIYKKNMTLVAIWHHIVRTENESVKIKLECIICISDLTDIVIKGITHLVYTKSRQANNSVSIYIYFISFFF